MVGEAGVCGGRGNMLVGELDLHVPVADARRREVVVDGLPLFGGAQLAIDTILHCDGTARPRTANEDGVVRTYPELVGPPARARLVVLAGEVAGRWSEDQVICQPAREPAIRRRAEQACGGCDGCPFLAAAQRRLSPVLCSSADGETPCSHEVMGDFRMSEIDMV